RFPSGCGCEAESVCKVGGAPLVRSIARSGDQLVSRGSQGGGERPMRTLFRICLLFCVLILATVAGHAKTITIPAQTLSNWQRTAAPLVYVFSDKTYLAVDYPSVGVNTIIFAGSPKSLNAFKKVTCTLLSGTVTIPSFTIPSTTDGQDARDAHLSFYLYDSASKAKIGPFGDYVNLAVPDVIAAA